MAAARLYDRPLLRLVQVKCRESPNEFRGFLIGKAHVVSLEYADLANTHCRNVAARHHDQAPIASQGTNEVYEPCQKPNLTIDTKVVQNKSDRSRTVWREAGFDPLEQPLNVGVLVLARGALHWFRYDICDRPQHGVDVRSLGRKLYPEGSLESLRAGNLSRQYGLPVARRCTQQHEPWAAVCDRFYKPVPLEKRPEIGYPSAPHGVAA